MIFPLNDTFLRKPNLFFVLLLTYYLLLIFLIQILFFGVRLGVFLEELLLHVAGHELVACELHREAAAAAGDRAERGRVARHLLQRHLGVEFLDAVLRLHAHDDGAASLEVAHHVAHGIARGEHLDVVDGLEDLRVGLAEGLAEGVAAGDRKSTRLNSSHRT